MGDELKDVEPEEDEMDDGDTDEIGFDEYLDNEEE